MEQIEQQVTHFQMYAIVWIVNKYGLYTQHEGHIH